MLTIAFVIGVRLLELLASHLKFGAAEAQVLEHVAANKVSLVAPEHMLRKL
jgi:hypothetical protein